MRAQKVRSWSTLLAAICFGAGLAACPGVPSTGNPNGSTDLSGGSIATDLAGLDLYGVDLSGTGGPTVDSACTAQAQNTCAKYQECAPFGYAASYSSMTQCVTRYKQLCLNYFGLPGSTRTTADVQRCAAGLATQTCMDYFDGTSAYQISCRSTGTLNDGTPCGASDQCKSQYCLINNGSTGCGVCSQYQKVGSTCQSAAGVPGCEPGSVCMGSTGSQKCVAQSGLNGSCNTTNGPSCKYPLACRGGICSQPKLLGDACDPTVGGDCDATKDVYCNSTSRKCEQLYRYVAIGGACGGTASPPYLICAASSRCSVTSGSGTCMAPAADDAACADPPSLPSCQAPSICRSGLCRFPMPSLCK